MSRTYKKTKPIQNVKKCKITIQNFTNKKLISENKFSNVKNYKYEKL